MSDNAQITEEDIHAYVDGTLSHDRRNVIDRLLETDSALAHRVSDYFSLNRMFHERYDAVLDEPVPDRLLPRTPAEPMGVGTLPVASTPRRFGGNAANWPRFGVAAATLILGIGIGALGTKALSGPGAVVSTIASSAFERHASETTDGAVSFAKQSAIAYVTYAPMVTRPVEVGADHEGDLVTWLSSRLGTDVRAPVLKQNGFLLMGGRLLPGNDGPIAQFMYHDSAGERITIDVSHRKTPGDSRAVAHYQDGSVHVFYWLTGNFGYAVSGAIDTARLLAISHQVFAQLGADGSVQAPT